MKKVKRRKGKYKIINDECISVMETMPDKCVDMILCDLPYGTTACKWDVVIPFRMLWEQYKRIIKDRGAIVLTATQPFSSELVMSNKDMFKYEWIWEKELATGFQTVKTQPMRIHEVILVFSKGTIASGSKNNMKYNPQGLIEVNKTKKVGKKPEYIGRRAKQEGKKYIQKYKNYPKTIIKFSRDRERFHPTQKPTELLEYLIKTYTNEGETVLDNCMGSGSTGVACMKSGRKFIGIELQEGYFDMAYERIENEIAGM